jgi:hypothetical protein
MTPAGIPAASGGGGAAHGPDDQGGVSPAEAAGGPTGRQGGGEPSAEEGAAVTEAEWLACQSAWDMLRSLRFQVSGRKLRLFACACCRVLWPEMQDQRSRRAVEVAERYADGLVSPRELLDAHADAEEALRALQADFPQALRRWREAAGAGPGAASGAVHPGTALMAADAVRLVTYPTLYDPTEEPDSSLLCSIIDGIGEARSNTCIPLDGPLREILGNPYRGAPGRDPTSLRTSDGAARRLAAAIYDGRRFEDLPVLADLLEEAGLTDAALLGHLRGPGPHALGCYALDAVLGKS